MGSLDIGNPSVLWPARLAGGRREWEGIGAGGWRPMVVLPGGGSAGVSNPLTGGADVASRLLGEARMGAELNPAQRLHALGQSLWLDSINRVMLRTGALARYVRELAVTGLTSNPTILGHAMAAGSDYDGSLARLVGEGVTGAQDLVYALALEVLADVAYDAAATVALARRLHDQAGFPNLLVKIPGTPQGLTAMEEAIT